MAQAVVTITYDDPLTGGCDESQHSVWMYGTIAVQAGPATYATGGLGTAVTGAINWVVGTYPPVANLTPKDVYFYGAKLTGTTIGGFSYQWNKASNTFQIAATAAGVAGTATQEELPNATAIPANVSNDTIRFEARFLKAVSGF